MFTVCENGHNLTLPNSYIYKNNGNRECRECDPKIQKRKKSSGSTWHEKRATFA